VIQNCSDNTVPYYIYLCHATFEAPKAVLLQIQVFCDFVICRVVGLHSYQLTRENFPKDLNNETSCLLGY